jgi:hypothetical protein
VHPIESIVKRKSSPKATPILACAASQISWTPTGLRVKYA